MLLSPVGAQSHLPQLSPVRGVHMQCSLLLLCQALRQSAPSLASLPTWVSQSRGSVGPGPEAQGDFAPLNNLGQNLEGDTAPAWPTTAWAATTTRRKPCAQLAWSYARTSGERRISFVPFLSETPSPPHFSHFLSLSAATTRSFSFSLTHTPEAAPT